MQQTATCFGPREFATYLSPGAGGILSRSVRRKSDAIHLTSPDTTCLG